MSSRLWQPSDQQQMIAMWNTAVPIMAQYDTVRTLDFAAGERIVSDGALLSVQGSTINAYTVFDVGGDRSVHVKWWIWRGGLTNAQFKTAIKESVRPILVRCADEGRAIHGEMPVAARNVPQVRRLIDLIRDETNIGASFAFRQEVRDGVMYWREDADKILDRIAAVDAA